MSFSFDRFTSLTDEEIWKKADEFRELVKIPEDQLVPIVEIIEIDLNIGIILHEDLYNLIGIEAFLSRDCSNLWVDEKRYFDLGWEPRNRFTLSHELGHLVLHKSIYLNLPIGSPEDWINFRQKNEHEISIYEYQADQFAGRLLVPRETLRSKVHSVMDLIKKMKEDGMNLDQIMFYVAIFLENSFGIEHERVYERIRKEKIFEDLNI